MTTYSDAEAARQRAVEALRTVGVGLTAEADRLAALPPITDRKTARAAAKAAANAAAKEADRMRTVEFRGGRFLARLFLGVEPIIGLRRAERLMAWLITHRPFYLRDR